jgi:hypothetical protein
LAHGRAENGDHFAEMTGRVLLGVVAALRAVLVPGEAGMMAMTPLQWPRLRRVRLGRPAPTAAEQSALRAA